MRAVRWLVLGLVVAAVAVVNESRSDVANQATLLCVVVGAALVGLVWRRRVWLGAALVGCTVAVEHVVAVALGAESPDIHLPTGWWGTATLLVLLAPALLGAYAGAGIRRLVSADGRA